MNYSIVDTLINNAFLEDFPYGDITSESLFSETDESSASLIAKEEGIVAGISVFMRVFELLGDVQCKCLCQDGQKVVSGTLLASLSGKTINILKGERTALNLIQRMSGIATITHQYVQGLNGTKTKLLDTRKTTPGLRYLEKYAVAAGGGTNHRFSLSDGILIKDNHIHAAGSITKAIQLTRDKHGFVRKIEVETENLTMVREALESKADIIMLDNMSNEEIREALQLIDGQALTECSGNITLDRIKTLSRLGVDYISCGSLTHSYKSLDISLKF